MRRTGDAGVASAALPTRGSRVSSLVAGRDWMLATPAILTLVLLFVAPYTILVVTSFLTHTPTQAYGQPFTLDNYSKVINDSFTWHVMWNTVRISLITTIVTAAVAYPVAAQIARARGALKSLLLVVVIAPLLVGVVVRTYAWTILLSDTGLINQGLEEIGFAPRKLQYNDLGIIIGLVHILLPYMVLSLAASLQNIDPDLRLAARSLGASRFFAFRRVTWPLALPGLVSGTVLVFVLAMSAYATPAVLGGFSFLVVPILVVQQVTVIFDWPYGSALALVFFLLTLSIVAVYVRVLRRALTRVS